MCEFIESNHGVAYFDCIKAFQCNNELGKNNE